MKVTMMDNPGKADDVIRRKGKMAMSDKLCCPKCGSPLVLEAIGNYGDKYHLKRDGSQGRKLGRLVYEYSGDEMVYCPECGENYDFRWEGKRVKLECEVDDDE